MASTIYEAENALIVGAEVKSYRPGASNAYVDYANNSGDYIEWTINQEAAGQYDLAFQYALGASNSRPLKLYINGEEQTDLLNFTSTGSWDQWNAITKTLQLNAGENSVRIEAAGSSGPNIDFLQVSDPVSGGEDTTTGGGEDTTAGGGEDTTTGGGEDTTAGGGEDTTSGGGEDTTSGGGGEDTTTGGNAAYDMMFEAEDAVIVGGVVSDYRAGASNAYVDYTNNTGDYIEWTVSLDQAGDYNLAFQYALGASASRPLQLSINGELQTGLVDFSSTGGWDQWQSVVETLALDAGNNVIRLEAAGKSGPNIDFMQVTSVASGEDTTSGGGGEDTTTGGDADVNVMFNFQNNSGDIPAGYLKDHGRGYDEATGYGWITEASVGSDAPVALDILTSGRDRNIAGYDQRLDTFIHMEDTNFSAAWEYKIANGTYAVTVSVGDGLVDDSDSSHSINIEGVSVIDNFMATPQRAYDVETAVVTVTDGKLTIDSVGGTKTKLNFVEIESVNTDTQPTIASASPLDNAVDVNRSKAVAFDVSLKEVGVGVDGASLTNATVSLYKTNGFEQIQGNLNTSGGGDTIIFKPTTALEANTDYTLIMDGATDANGTEFIPYTTSFTTGEAVDVQAAQHTISVVAEHDMAISLQISPDESQLYATTVDGKIMRWDIDPTTGALSNKETFLDLQGDPSTPSAIIGLAFDPNDPNVLWVSHNGTYFAGVEDFTGQVSKLHLQDGEGFNATVEEYIIGLPRSNHDHMTNSLSFGPDGDLYVTQGSNTAMGALDTAWGEREERELTAAVLKIDPDVETNGVPINVQTEDYMLEDGTMTFGDYDPYAANAPVQIFATGMRNAYDHVWHSNGELYVPDNGSAAGGVVPDDPNTAANERVASVGSQHDVLYQVEEGGYYGHPNASRGEYILRGGNPTDGVDPGEVVPKNGFKGYNVGVQPDPDYQTHVFDFGDKQSANGIIELKTDGYGASFQNNLLVVRYSAGNDIVSIQLDAQGNVVGSSIFASDLVNPLDLVEHGSSGRIYLAEFRGYESKISMFTPSEDGSEGTGSGGGEDTTSGGSGGDTVPGGTDTEFLGLYEAEDADYTGPELRNHREGFTGEGFLDFSNTVDDYIEWTVQNADAGMYQLDWRYALGDNARPLDLYINEQLVVNNLNFDNTGGWGNWQEVGVQAQLQAGTNTIRLEADGSSGGNIDSMTISEIDAVA